MQERIIFDFTISLVSGANTGIEFGRRKVVTKFRDTRFYGLLNL